MRKLIIVAILSLAVYVPACAILVDAVDDAASLAFADALPYMGCFAGWDVEGGTRYSAGSCTLIRNNAHDGAWVITAGHVPYRDPLGDTFNFLRCTFESSYFDGFTRGNTSYVPSKTVAAIREKVFYHPTQDIALVKLEHLVRDAKGNLVAPIEMHTGDLNLTDGQIILIGGAGQTGTPDQGGTQGTGYRDGYNRCARGLFDFFFSSEGILEFKRSVPIPGIACIGDSGGFAAIESGGKIVMIGVLVSVFGSGEYTGTCFELLGYNDDFPVWMEDIITGNGEIQSAVENWNAYE